jgi:hypothetical protein
MMHEHHGADQLTPAEQHRKYHHHHENKDDVDGYDKEKHEHHHKHRTEHVVTAATSGRSQKDSKWRGGCDKKCVFAVEEDTRQNA